MHVSVDDDFARFGAKSYAINKINSVEVRERQPHGLAGAVICGLLALILLLPAFGAIANPQQFNATTLVAGLVFVGLAYWQWQRSKIREYQLFLMTSSSEAQALVSRDADEVLTLRDGIESAMARHSRAGSDR